MFAIACNQRQLFEFTDGPSEFLPEAAPAHTLLGHRHISLIFLNRYFHPDHSATSQMLSDLAFALAGRGHAVAVITSRQRYDAPEVPLPPRETMSGVSIHRVWTSRFGRHNLAGRVLDYMTFYMSAAWTLWQLARSGDVTVAKTDPPMLSVLAAPIARLCGAKLVNWLQDIFPEVAQALGVGRGRMSGFAYWVMRWLRDRSLKSAAMNVALGRRMAARLAMRGVAPERIRIISNWADGTVLKTHDHSYNALRQAWGLSGKFVVGYSGNFGRAHDYTTLVDAIARVEAKRPPALTLEPALDSYGDAGTARAATLVVDGEPHDPLEIVWLFIGGGALFEAFKSEVAKRRLTSVVFQPYQPRERLSESLSAADVHLVSLRPELEGLIVPSKFYGIAAAGRPTVFIGDLDGEIARVIARVGGGVTIAQGDGAALAQAILDFAGDPNGCRQMGEAARQAFEAEFDKSVAVERWEALLRDVASADISGRALKASLGALPKTLQLRETRGKHRRGHRAA